MRHQLLLSTAALALSAAVAAGQGAASLKSALEGRVVKIRLDMPATDKGVDVHPGHTPDMDSNEYQKRLNNSGTAFRTGNYATISRVTVDQDKGRIILELNGGGAADQSGFFAKLANSGKEDQRVPKTEPSRRERDLEEMLRKEKDKAARRPLEDELNELQRDRKRIDDLLEKAYEPIVQSNVARAQLGRLAGGARLNVYYRDSIAPYAVTPDRLLKDLNPYVEVAQDRSSFPPLSKGAAMADIVSAYGQPIYSKSWYDSDNLKRSIASWRSGDGIVVADFVEDVLVRSQVVAK